MKTPTELKFDQIIKRGFHEVLKPEGFKKRGNNFYRQLSDLGQIINIQKSQFYSKDQIHFTINTGIFVPEHWRGLSYNAGKELPTFPTEPECLIRKRIGSLRDQHDTWYDVDERTNEEKLIVEMRENVERYILPYFNSIKSRQDFLSVIKKEKLIFHPLGGLIVYGELNMIDEAKAEYQRMLDDKKWNPSFLQTIKEYGQKYGVS